MQHASSFFFLSGLAFFLRHWLIRKKGGVPLAREAQQVEHLRSSRSSLALAAPPLFLATRHVLLVVFVLFLPSLLIFGAVVLVLRFFQEGVFLRVVHDCVERQVMVSQPLLTALDDLPTKPRNRIQVLGGGFRVEFVTGFGGRIRARLWGWVRRRGLG